MSTCEEVVVQETTDMLENHEEEEAKDGVPEDEQAKNRSPGQRLMQSVRYRKRKGGSLLSVKSKMRNGQVEDIVSEFEKKKPTPDRCEGARGKNY